MHECPEDVPNVPNVRETIETSTVLYMIYLVPLTGADGGGELNVFGYQVSIYSRRTKEDILEVGVTVLVMVVGLWPTTVCVSVLQLDWYKVDWTVWV